ncbi:lipid A biosynthesis acyltransferase [Hyphomicrobium methylovorum]|uniref:lysophospholipid acyltransferase family protein n=1 Tax=Hyphomicrobium methylovorum TaxID=84 RepID=UPI0015E6EFEC|nr:lipid A biosynthesis acyltransferase [Hyphomicrobium methylovorum]MBA2127794.1 lipid A biosynthesis acyltransferase [Hyphomicrobium methylovorum]
MLAGRLRLSTAVVSPLRDLQFRLEYALLRVIAGGIRAVPLDWATRFSAWSWRRLAPIINPKRHNRALDNLRIAFPEKTEEERLAIALAHWENLGRVMAETMRIDQIIADPSRMTIRDPHVFSRYSSKLGPIVGASLHVGNWELAIWPLTIAGADPACVYRSVNNPYVDRYIRYQRRDLYPGGLFGRGKVEGEHDESQKTARLIMDFVRRGGRLGLVCDLYDRTGLPVPFFGKPARTVAIPAMIARRTGARIWMSRCLRVGKDSRFEIELKELRIPRTANHGEDVKWATAEMTRQFEAWVRETPEQWMWSNRRWS